MTHRKHRCGENVIKSYMYIAMECGVSAVHKEVLMAQIASIRLFLLLLRTAIFHLSAFYTHCAGFFPKAQRITYKNSRYSYFPGYFNDNAYCKSSL